MWLIIIMQISSLFTQYVYVILAKPTRANEQWLITWNLYQVQRNVMDFLAHFMYG